MKKLNMKFDEFHCSSEFYELSLRKCLKKKKHMKKRIFRILVSTPFRTPFYSI